MDNVFEYNQQYQHKKYGKRTYGEHGHDEKNNNHKYPARNRYKNSTLLLRADLEQFPEPIQPPKVIMTRSRTKAVTN